MHWAVTQHSVVTHWLKLKEDVERDVESGNSWLRKMLGIRNVKVVKQIHPTHIEHRGKRLPQTLKREMATYKTHEKGLAKQEEDVWKHLKAIYRDMEGLGYPVTVGGA